MHRHVLIGLLVAPLTPLLGRGAHTITLLTILIGIHAGLVLGAAATGHWGWAALGLPVPIYLCTRLLRRLRLVQSWKALAQGA